MFVRTQLLVDRHNMQTKCSPTLFFQFYSPGQIWAASGHVAKVTSGTSTTFVSAILCAPQSVSMLSAQLQKHALVSLTMWKIWLEYAYLLAQLDVRMDIALVENVCARKVISWIEKASSVTLCAEIIVDTKVSWN